LAGGDCYRLFFVREPRTPTGERVKKKPGLAAGQKLVDRGKGSYALQINRTTPELKRLCSLRDVELFP
jgi:hypothetical protein